MVHRILQLHHRRIVLADSEAGAVLDDLARNGVDCSGVQHDGERPTAYYTALIDPSGELSVGWADMDVYEALTPATLQAALGDRADARGWFIDSNLPAATLQAIAASCPATTWLAADTISPAKAVRLKSLLGQIDTLFCNRMAAATLLDVAIDQQTTTELAAALTQRGVGTAIVTDGPRGLALATADGVRQLPPPVDLDKGYADKDKDPLSGEDDDEEGGDEDGETMSFDMSQLQQMQQEMMQQAMQNIDMEQIQKMQQLAMENMQKMMAGMYGNNNNTEEDTNK